MINIGVHPGNDGRATRSRGLDMNICMEFLLRRVLVYMYKECALGLELRNTLVGASLIDHFVYFTARLRAGVP